ncbi:virulence factor TspB C-terminal domain-related protein [Acinetobacter ursingii]|uniref:virulence factor TspB C-terminal domain-related protein n=1 Tax=Acinetobacter ursingii TaxID=108980 RepID=UPI002449B58C|nr:virulence factor TspB C-terminal domain-related protein [Acinetobacter ursingii]MDG9861532.1 virulence factor TspB C-terminal domain-related protein [Acinetobacter ursingii]MDG9894180.1 virulence factor TspB C-terminal domain-related protein [Acinetobacter ursingii]MDH0007714.1 virulence factor TspB C-terminal domain-related protein [Acinetobacter ursingii]MDH0480468.1 virulence factor TspB C-terminal domain-related protein [Acinetobacter ursingii]MDH2120111.1 virulence factor TspB C-termin
MGRYKTYLTILLMFSIHMMPFNAARAAGLGGWILGGGVSQGASVIYNGSKEVILNGAKKIATGTAKITPVAGDVAKLLGKGLGGVALSVAVEQLLGSVDWVLDPANNQIRYYVDPDSQNAPDPNWQYNCHVGGVADSIYECGSRLIGTGGIYDHAQSVTSCRWYNFEARCTFRYVVDGVESYAEREVAFNRFTRVDPIPEREEKFLPLPTVAQQVISNAESGNADAQSVTKAAADTIVAEAETDNTKARPIINQLEASQSIPTSNTATGETVPKEETGENTGTDTKGSDISLDFPIFCDWAPSVCQAANVVIQKPAEWAENIKAAYDDAVDYFKSEPEQTDNELDIDQNTETEPDSSINFSTSCPAKIPLTFQWNGGTLDFSFDFTMWCQAISTFVYPIVVALGSLHALYIVAGVRQDG